MENSRTLPSQCRQLARRLRVCTAALALAFPAVLPQVTHAANPVPPPAPANLQVPAGNRAFREGHASGTQDYICLPSGSGGVAWTWVFYGPQATLLDDNDEQIITHFLSPNPIENGTLRATWQDSKDTSTVWAKMIASSSDADFVAAGAIPWFLLQIVGEQPGPTNGDTLMGTDFIQRLDTSGGSAPPTGCAQMSDVGNKALVPYTADYFFYKAVCGGDCNSDGQVTVDEVVTMVNIALVTEDIAACAVGDINHDGRITVEEMVKAVDEILSATNAC